MGKILPEREKGHSMLPQKVDGRMMDVEGEDSSLPG